MCRGALGLNMSTRSFGWFTLLGVAGVLWVVGCADPAEQFGQREIRRCFECHGSTENGNFAPPPVNWGDSGGDAHQNHLQATSSHLAIPCETCHRVPNDVFEAGHIDSDLPAEVVFANLAMASEANPIYDGEGTCSDVYCHGATLQIGGGTTPSPVWTDADDDEAECGFCHGAPPPAPHPQRTTCDVCHGDVVDSDGEIFAPELHINGEVNVALTCGSCHGDDELSAPPSDTQGNSDTTARGVGAHRSHLRESDWHAPVECSDCHVVPAEVDDLGHTDSELPAELSWGASTYTDGAEPSFDGTHCTNVSCHGAGLASGGGTNTQPTWTLVDDTQAACGTCHGLPPSGVHPNRDDCESCHSPVVDSIDHFVAPELHINGTVETATECHSCHGDADSPAPPFDTLGETATTSPGVGAHQAHLRTSNWRATIRCEDCHPVPETINEDGHRDALRPADFNWGWVATYGGELSPNYDPDTNTCTDIYCHSGLRSGGALTEPIWTLVDDTQAACGNCHSLPPQGPHPSRDDCHVCHDTVINADEEFLDAELHINGVVNY